ncbi:MAG: trypsin-like peptidase domain-containing protein [Hyphomicrobium sp.]|nr:trypsin-like peptidase domain-containing protein [Hyphomicrobium sp.]
MRQTRQLEPRNQRRGGHLLALAGAVFLTLGAALPTVALSFDGAASHVPDRHTATGFVQPVAVFGPDDRTPLPSRMRALEDKIGLLYEPRSRSVCTAFCVDQSTVATAAHCFYRTRGEAPVPLAKVSFRLASMNRHAAGVRIAGADHGAAAQNIVSGTTSLSTTPPIDATRDWALVRLASPVCRSGGLPLVNRRPTELSADEEARPIYQVGYHGDFGNWRLTLSPPCAVRRLGQKIKGHVIAGDFADAGALILHTCDTGGASSGSPLLTDGPRGPEVVGINVGTYLQSQVLMQSGEVLHRYRSDTIANTGVSTVAFLEQKNQLAGVDILSTPAAIGRLQTALLAAGYYRGPTDGRYSSELRIAIEKFEATERRPRTGIASTEILRRLEALVAVSEIPAINPASVETGSVGVRQPRGP